MVYLKGRGHNVGQFSPFIYLYSTVDYNGHLQMCEECYWNLLCTVAIDKITPVSLAYYEVYYVAELSSLT